MPLIEELDYGTPAADADTDVTLTIDGHEVTVPTGTVCGLRLPTCRTSSWKPTSRCVSSNTKPSLTQVVPDCIAVAMACPSDISSRKTARFPCTMTVG